MCVWSIYSPIHVLIFSTYLFLFTVKGRSEPIPACILYRQANIFLKNIFGSPWGRTCYWVLDSLYEQKRNMSVVGQVKVLSSKNVITFCPLSAALQVQHRGQCLIITAGPRLWIIKRTSGSIQFHNKGSGMNAGQQNVLRTIILSLLVNMGLHSSGVYLPCVSSVKGKRDIIRIHNHWVSLCVCVWYQRTFSSAHYNVIKSLVRHPGPRPCGTSDVWLSVWQVHQLLSWRQLIQRGNPSCMGFQEKRPWGIFLWTKTRVWSGFDSSSTVRYEHRTNTHTYCCTHTHTCKLPKQMHRIQKKKKTLRTILKIGDWMLIIKWWKISEKYKSLQQEGMKKSSWWVQSGIFMSCYAFLQCSFALHIRAKFMLTSYSVSTRPSQRCRSNSTWVTFKR